MNIISPSRQAGPISRASKFTGAVFPYVTMPATDGVVINTVDFAPCARTYWHRHELGQILFVVAGRGLIRAEGGPIRVMRAGDTIWTPPGERHWHGGSRESYVVHIAVSMGRTEWEGEVPDDEFNQAVEDDS